MKAYVASLGVIGSLISGVRSGRRRVPPLVVPTAIAVLSLIITAGPADTAQVLVAVTAASQVPVLHVAAGDYLVAPAVVAVLALLMSGRRAGQAPSAFAHHRVGALAPPPPNGVPAEVEVRKACNA